MVKGIIAELTTILSKDDSSEVIFVDENGNEVSIQDAIKNKIKGTIVEKKFSQKEELTKLLFDKERMGVEDLLSTIEAFEKTIYTIWESSGYAFKSKNYEHLKEVLEKYKVKPISKRETKKPE